MSLAYSLLHMSLMFLIEFSSDEILYDAHIHPEQYSNTLSTAQVKQLHKSIHYVCGFAVEHLADSSKFPEEWLFKHRWGKGKKDSSTTLPNGLKFTYLTVGGRTSCVVPSVQKKTGPVKKEVKLEDEDEDDEQDSKEVKQKKASKLKKSKTKEPEAGVESESEVKTEAEPPPPKPSKSRKRNVKEEEKPAENGNLRHEDESEQESKPASKKRKSNTKADTSSTNAKPEKQKANGVKKENQSKAGGRRRSGRTSGKDA